MNTVIQNYGTFCKMFSWSTIFLWLQCIHYCTWNLTLLSLSVITSIQILITITSLEWSLFSVLRTYIIVSNACLLLTNRNIKWKWSVERRSYLNKDISHLALLQTGTDCDMEAWPEVQVADKQCFHNMFHLGKTNCERLWWGWKCLHKSSLQRKMNMVSIFLCPQYSY
jgi:hypothetical protein